MGDPYDLHPLHLQICRAQRAAARVNTTWAGARDLALLQASADAKVALLSAPLTREEALAWRLCATPQKRAALAEKIAERRLDGAAGKR